MNDYDFDQDSFYNYVEPDWQDCWECGGQEVVNPHDGVCGDCGFDHCDAWESGWEGNEDAAMESHLFGDC